MEKTWKSFDVSGNCAYVLKEKFKLLKQILKWWNKEVFGWIDMKIYNIVKDLHELNSLVSSKNCVNNVKIVDK